MTTPTNNTQAQTVEIYSTPTCHFCHMAKDWFAAHGVSYQDHNVATDLEKRKEMVEITGQLGVPVIKIGNEVMVGFNPDHMAKILNIPS